MQVKKNQPEKVCHLLYDQLHVGAAVFVYNEAIGQVVQLHEESRFGLLYLFFSFFCFVFVCLSLTRSSFQLYEDSFLFNFPLVFFVVFVRVLVLVLVCQVLGLQEQTRFFICPFLSICLPLMFV